MGFVGEDSPRYLKGEGVEMGAAIMLGTHGQGSDQADATVDGGRRS